VMLQCEEGTEIVADKSPIEELFEPVTEAMSFYLYNIDRGPKHSTMNRLSKAVQIFMISSTFYYLSYFIYTVCFVPMNELTTIMFYMIACVLVMAVSGSIIMYQWQSTGAVKRFFRMLHSVNEGKGVMENKEDIMKLNRSMKWFRTFMLVYNIFFIIYFSSGIRPYGIDYDRFADILYFKRLMVIYNITSGYIILGWTMEMHTYCYLIRVAVAETEYFIQEAIEVKCASESEAILFFTDSIRRNSRLSISRFAFFQIGMAIPSTLFVAFATIMRINAPLLEFVPSLILVILTLALFRIITIYPARLHDQVKKTRALFCANIRQWIPYGQSVHTAALVLSSHLEQNDLGVTIWGFALLSKPLILTSLSAMTTALAIFLQFSDCKKQFEANLQLSNRTL
ncbi:hypothetical protein PMAYCL1PPCAC_05553, partial [Pristionchus mayeri]